MGDLPGISNAGADYPKGTNYITIRDVNANATLNLQDKSPIALVFFMGGREVLRFTRGDDGVLCAKYDPADFDTAAQALVDEAIRRLGNV